MKVRFSEVGINERFKFVSQYPSLCISGTKISKRKYATDNGTICTIGDSKFPCDVDNTCACIYPVQLTFDDLSICDIFQFGLVWYSAADIEHTYYKLDNMHYANFYDGKAHDISLTSGMVCTPNYVQSAQ